MQRLLYEMKNGNTLNFAALTVASDVLKQWEGFPKQVSVQSKKYIVRKLKLLYGDYSNLKRSINRCTVSETQKRIAFLNKINCEFDIKLKKPRTTSQSVQTCQTLDIEADHSDHDTDYDSNSETCSNYEKPTMKKKYLPLTPQLVASIDHAGLSNFKAASVVLATAHFLKQDPANVPVSSSTIFRQRKKLRCQIAEDIKRAFCEDLSNAFLILHWDGKILPKWHVTDGNSDKLAVVVSNGRSTKVLGVADLERGTSNEQFLAIEKQLKEWNIEDHVKGISFDTTSVNTGNKSGTCQKLREKYNGNILTLACRHHVLEILISAVYSTAMKEQTRSPDISLFTRFRSQWKQINPLKFQNGIDLPDIRDHFDENEKSKLINFMMYQLSLNDKTRKDYNEVLELGLIFLNQKTFSGKEIKIRIPGAVHRARFMARIIYGLKIFALRSQFELTGIAESTHEM